MIRSGSTKKQFNPRQFLDRLFDAILQNRLVESIKTSEIRQLLSHARRVFKSQPVFLKINAPVIICGDMHGQFNDLMRILDSEGFPNERNYLFLGDYVDRGTQSVELILFMFACKICYPRNFFLLRGNHETRNINFVFGFYQSVMEKYRSQSLFEAFQSVFEYMPLSALVSNRILCMHGGLSLELLEGKTLEVLNTIRRPLKDTEITERFNPLAVDLLWADPDVNIEAFGPSQRRIGNLFGQRIIDIVRKRFKLDLIVRAHQVVLDGHEFFNGDVRSGLITIFSAPHYCGRFDNAGAVLCVAANLNISIKAYKSQGTG